MKALHRILLSLFLLLGGLSSSAQLVNNNVLLDQAKVSVNISTIAAEPIHGVFVLTTVFDEPVTSFTEADITVTNGTPENLFSVDNITWTANIIPTLLDDVEIVILKNSVTPKNSESNTLTLTVSVDLAFLTNPTKTDVYYEFRELVGDGGVAVLTTDPGRRDLSNNSRTLALVNSPTMSNCIAFADVDIDKMVFRTTGTQAGSLGQDGSNIFNRSFSVLASARSGDGQNADAWFVCGNNDGTDFGFRITILGGANTGKLQLNYQTSIWLSTAAVFPNGATGLHDLHISYDFESNVLTVKYDGSDVAGSFTSGSMAALDPTAYACSANLYIGNYNNNGTAPTLSNVNQIQYFTVHPLLTSGQATSLLSYLNARRGTFQVMDILSGADIKNPHDVIFSAYHPARFYASGKGHDTGTTTDGSFNIGEIDEDGQLTLLGSYVGHGDQLDGETVLEISATRVIHFVDDNALLIDVSNPASPTKIRTVANGNGVINGAIIMGNRYVIGANKGGFLDVFDCGVDLSNIDAFTLAYSYDTSTDLGGDGPHDITAIDSEYAAIVNRHPTVVPTYPFAIYKMMNAGSIISSGSLTYTSRLSDASLLDANRCRLVPGTNTIALSCNPNFATVDVTTLASPFVADTFDMTTFASGIDFYRNRWAMPTWQVGLRLLDVATDNTNIIQDAGYYNDTTFTPGNASFHDVAIYEGFSVPYLLVSAQSSSQLVSFKISGY